MRIRKILCSGTALAAVTAAWMAGCTGSGSDTESMNQPPVAQRPESGPSKGAPSKGTQSGGAQTVALQVGADVPAFDVLTVSGELKGQELCYV
jgi:hypothetical protein